MRGVLLPEIVSSFREGNLSLTLKSDCPTSWLDRLSFSKQGSEYKTLGKKRNLQKPKSRLLSDATWLKETGNSFISLFVNSNSTNLGSLQITSGNSENSH